MHFLLAGSWRGRFGCSCWDWDLRCHFDVGEELGKGAIEYLSHHNLGYLQAITTCVSRKPKTKLRRAWRDLHWRTLGVRLGSDHRRRLPLSGLLCRPHLLFVGSFALDDKQAIVIIVVFPTSSTLMLFSMLRCHIGPVWPEKLSWMHWAECQEGAMHGL